MLFCAQSAFSLGLGELNSSSFLGEPLEAIILVSDGQESYSPDEVLVRHVGQREARNLGIELAGGLQRYRVKPVIRNGQLAIAVTTADPVHEPFLNILIELKWPTGTVYREYTVFLDPIEFKPVSTAASEPVTKLAKQPAPRPQALTERRQQTSPLTIGSGDYRVQSGDSLSKIADTLVRGTDVSRQQMMQWLLANNPRAFINGDPNRLMAGVRLTLPENAEMPATVAQTSQSVARDMPSAGEMPSQQPESVPGTPDLTVEQQEQTSERLTIVTPGVSEEGVSTAASEIAELQARLATTNELIDRLQRDNEAMRQRLLNIEKSDYADSLERLILLKDKELELLRADIERRDQASSVSTSSAQQSTEPADEVVADGDGEQQIATADAETTELATTESMDSSGGRVWALVILLIVAIVGAVFFFIRWRELEKEKASSSKQIDETLVNDEELMEELDQIIASQSEFETYEQPKTADKVVQETREAFEHLGKAQAGNRRPDAVVKESIRRKTESYTPPEVPPELQEHDKHAHDALDDVISEAMAAAHRGDFDVAEALLVAERTQQARISTGDTEDKDSRLEIALEYVQQLAQYDKSNR